MEIAEKVESLEDEFKILKAELKETLVSVRDFLLMIKPLPGENGGIIHSDVNQMIDTDSIVTNNNNVYEAGEPSPDIDDESSESETSAEDIERELPDQELEAPDSVDDLLEPEMLDEFSENELGYFPESEEMTSEDQDEMPLENSSSLEEGGNMKEREGADQRNPQVNLLANLVHWISVAKKDIGSDRLPRFLDVYGVSRQLPDGLKEFILHLADILDEPSTDTNLADNWTRLTLELHGILAGGTPFHSPEAFVDDKNTEKKLSNNGGNKFQIISETIIEANQIDIC